MPLVNLPAGTVSGAPKIRAAEAITSWEQENVCQVQLSAIFLRQDMDFAIKHRTMIFEMAELYVCWSGYCLHLDPR